MQSPVQPEPVCPNWWKGFHWLPFEWQDLGRLALPAGRVELAVQPDWIPWGCFFADVAAVELQPVSPSKEDER